MMTELHTFVEDLDADYDYFEAGMCGDGNLLLFVICRGHPES